MAKNTNTRITKLEKQYFGNQTVFVLMDKSNPEKAQKEIEQLKKEMRRYFVMELDPEELLA